MEITYLNSENNPLQELTQWDINRKIKIHGLELKTAPVIHFYNDYQSRALVVNSILEDKDIIVNIPNILLQNDVPITLAIFITIPNENIEGKTIYMEKLPVRAKLKPNDYEYKENIDYIDWIELSEEAKKQLEQMNKIITETQEKLDNGEFIGPQGEKGDTPIRGVDYWTEQDKQEVITETKDLVIPLIENNTGNKLNIKETEGYKFTFELLNPKNEILSTKTIDLPIESMVVNASYSNGILTLTLQNGQTLDVNISDIVNGLVNETTFNQAVEEINQRITSTDDEVNFLTGEVSDIKNKLDNYKYDLPIATQDVLGGVKPIAKTDKMTELVGVDENGRLYTKAITSGTGGAIFWNDNKSIIEWEE